VEAEDEWTNLQNKATDHPDDGIGLAGGRGVAAPASGANWAFLELGQYLLQLWH
jgi:hypothetical protein